MNTIEPVSLKELKTTDYASLIKHRIRKILMICSNYDAFILEEDGQIEAQIYREYIDLNISNPPRFIWATTSAKAEAIINSNDDIDMVICMYNAGDKDVFTFAGKLKKKSSSIPFVLLTHFSREIYRNISRHDTSGVDYVFSWHGNTELIVAIIKLFEDLANADDDILKVGVQAILLVEDSIRYYSTYLPELYKLVLKQSAEFLKDTFNEQHRKVRKRSRPKILLATNYEDAMRMYEKYKHNLLGVISDVGFVLHKGDSPDAEKLDRAELEKFEEEPLAALSEQRRVPVPTASVGLDGSSEAVPEARRRLTATQTAALMKALSEWNGSKRALARRFGISERTLYRLLRKHNYSKRD